MSTITLIIVSIVSFSIGFAVSKLTGKKQKNTEFDPEKDRLEKEARNLERGFED